MVSSEWTNQTDENSYLLLIRPTWIPSLSLSTHFFFIFLSIVCYASILPSRWIRSNWYWHFFYLCFLKILIFLVIILLNTFIIIIKVLILLSLYFNVTISNNFHQIIVSLYWPSHISLEFLNDQKNSPALMGLSQLL